MCFAYSRSAETSTTYSADRHGNNPKAKSESKSSKLLGAVAFLAVAAVGYVVKEKFGPFFVHLMSKAGFVPKSEFDQAKYALEKLKKENQQQLQDEKAAWEQKMNNDYVPKLKLDKIEAELSKANAQNSNLTTRIEKQSGEIANLKQEMKANYVSLSEYNGLNKKFKSLQAKYNQTVENYTQNYIPKSDVKTCSSNSTDDKCSYALEDCNAKLSGIQDVANSYNDRFNAIQQRCLAKFYKETCERLLR